MPDGVSVDADSALSVDVVRALATLPRMQRAVLVMRFFEDRSTAEVAEALGIGEGTVKKYVHRGCANLRNSNLLTEGNQNG